MGLPIKLALPIEFLKPEIRDGYEVSEKLKKIWAVELDLLCELIRVCRKHDIKMQVFAGTLLGAVRHKGFIPWDDDVDVAMTREEYDKLLAVADKEFQHPYFLQNALSDRRYFCPYSRFRNSETTGVISGQDSPEYNGGIYIDVFVLDGCAKSSLAFRFQHVLRCFVRKMLTVYYQQAPRNRSIKEKILRLSRLVALLLPYQAWYAAYVRVMTMYKKSDMVAFLSHTTWDKSRHWLYRKETEELTAISFEHVMLPVSKYYHEILTRNYKEYMQFPPASERGKWHEGKIHFEPEMPYQEYMAKKGTCC